MSRKYKTGELREILISNGLQHLNKVGFQEFSIRKVASMSHVSHSAPYKHFHNKEEFLNAISLSVMEKFKADLLNVASEYRNEPYIRLAEMGKKYVQYMVENPEHMKFLFLTARKQSVKIKGNDFEYTENSPFAIFRETASAYLDSIHADPIRYVTDILSIWSVIHGISVLIVEESIVFDGDYLNMVSNMIYNRLQIPELNRQY